MNCFPLSLVVRYFYFLANKKVTSSTLKSIRSVLSEPLKVYVSNDDISLDPWLQKIIQFVKRRNLKSSFNFPSWNLVLVINMLKCRQEVNTDFGFKALFIRFLACPYRI